MLLIRAFLIGFIIVIHGYVGDAFAAIDESLSEHVGKTVVLPCPVNKDTCGELHSINWFKGDNRIAAMLLDDSNITSVTAEYVDRVTVEQNPFRLLIKDLRIDDEDIYLCDTTFFIPVETCDNYNGYRIELNVLVPPTEVVILDEKGDRIENGTLIGPLQEGHTLRSSCVVRNTRPQPAVGWFRGNKRLTTHSPTYDEKDGLYTATLELSLVLSRQDLSSSIECRVESAAVKEVIRTIIDIDLQVRPTGITLSGVEHHTVQGSKVVLTCQIYGARPPVNITWTNSSKPISPEENSLTEIRTQAIEQKDGTYHTISDLIFNATRFENDMIFRCDAENVVLQMNREKPIYSFVTLEVMYPPVVKVSPNQITVNTTDAVLLNCEYVANPASLTSVVWFRNGDNVNVNDTQRYEGGNSENVALVIRSTDKDDIGNYTCQLSNAIGKGISETQIELDVQYAPIVEVLMIPDGPVKENDEANVTLYCNIVDANPSILTKVRWYANSSLLKELPDCSETNEDLCHIDPSKLLLESIGRGFFYNYSCEGYNAAGWGTRSDDKELMVHYEPGPATLTHFPLIAVKKKSVTFSCSVDDPGYPESNRYRWFRGGRGPLQDVVTKDWTVEPVGLDSRTNYSCYAYNDGGHGAAATVQLEVHAPPFFIKNLFPYTGILYSSRNASLMCRIECVPRCTIAWYKDGVPMDDNNERYFVREDYMAASPATGDFESVMSVLHFNMSAWPNKKFDIDADNANYSCVSSGNEVGAGIKSATYFSIEYPPDNTSVSHEIVYVLEDTIPGRVLCKSKANPEPSYEWRFNNKTITRGNALIINSPMTRNGTGRYVCVAFNKHGRSVAETNIDVQYKPRCEIERREINDQDTLICTAFGNPEEADFSWSIKAENESVEQLGSGNNNNNLNKSFYILEEYFAIARTYRCIANNTVGSGTFCEIEVAEQLAWWQRWDRTTLIILIASILAVLLLIVVICCIIICICRRRRRQDKYHTDVSISATQSVLSYQPASPLPSSTSSQGLQQAVQSVEVPRSPPRWPLRPGVMVHVRSDTKRNLAANRMTGVGGGGPSTSAIPRSTVSGAVASSDSTIVESSLDTTTTTLHNATASSTTALTTLSQSQLTLTPQQHAIAAHNSSATPSSASLGRIPRSSKQRQLAQCGDGSLKLSARNMGSGAGNGGANLRLGFQSLPRPSAMARVLPNNSILLDDSKAAAKSEELEICQNLTEPDVPPPLPARNPRRLLLLSPHNSTNSTAVDMSANSATELLPQSLLPKVTKTATNRTKDDHDDGDVSAIGIMETSPETTTAAGNTANSADHNRAIDIVEKFLSHVLSRVRRKDRHRDSQRSHIGLLGMFNVSKGFWKTRRHNSTSSESPFATKHRLKGIRCSGSVTYKKTPVLQPRSAAASSSALAKNNNNNNSSNNNHNNNNNNNNSNNNNNIVIDAAATTLTTKSPTLSPPKATTAATSPRQALEITQPTNQIHDKSSSLGDPLTEPGEYENLPFHGLQTAPNKFTTTPTSFNNNTNVVRVAPRPKRLTSSNNNNQLQHQTIGNHHHQQQQQQQQQYNTIQFSRSPASEKSLGNNINKSIHSIQNSTTATAPPLPSQSVTAASSSSANPHQITYNLNSCFPKSYTEYYHQQQQQKCTASNAQLLNSIEHDYPYPAVAAAVAGAAPAINNPFLAATNFKKFDTVTGNLEVTTSDAAAGATGSMHRRRKPIIENHVDKKFYSLKFSGRGRTSKAKDGDYQYAAAAAAPLQFGDDSGSGAGGGGAGAGGKCKRHHSFAGGSVGDIDSNGGRSAGNTTLPACIHAQSKQPMRFYEPPVYENLNDSVQIHECQVESHLPATTIATMSSLHSLSAAIANNHHPKKRHQQRQHQKKDDFNLAEPERLTIYRSDSGISNSSFECATPVAAPRLQPAAGVVMPTGTVTGGGGGRSVAQQPSPPPPADSARRQQPKKGELRGPLYMNIEQNGAGGDQSAIANSPYESASSSQNDRSATTDPTSMSSCNSLYSSGTGTTGKNRCHRHHPNSNSNSNPNQTLLPPPGVDITTPEDLQQYQLGHHAHSLSSISVASSNASARKGRKRSPITTAAAYERAPNTNPFLATTFKEIGTDTKQHQQQQQHSASSIASSPARHEQRTNGQSDPGCAAPATASQTIYQQQFGEQVSPQRSHYQQQEHNKFHGSNQSRQQHQQVLISQKLIPSAVPATTAAISPTNPRTFPLSPSATSLTSKTSITKCSPTAFAGRCHHHRHQSQVAEANHRRCPVTSATTTTSNCDRTNTKPSCGHRCSTCTHHQQHQPHQHHPGYITRPIKLPLRKHHSFHFQSSQTVAGRLQQLRQQTQLYSYPQHKPKLSPHNWHPHQHEQEGTPPPPPPPILRHLPSENSAFKPISPLPSPSPSNHNCNKQINKGKGKSPPPPGRNSEDESEEAILSMTRVIPRICGTSLKRHMSNVETYDSSRYNLHRLRMVNGTPHPATDHHSLPAFVDVPRRQANYASDDDDDDDDSSPTSSANEQDLSEEIAGIVITRSEPPPTLDLDSLSLCNPHLLYSVPGNRKNLLHVANTADDMELQINSDSEMIRRQKYLQQQQMTSDDDDTDEADYKISYAHSDEDGSANHRRYPTNKTIIRPQFDEVII